MNSYNLKIVIVTSEFPPQPGGIGNHAYNLALHLFNNGYQVKVIADVRSENGKEEAVFDASLPFQVIRIKRYHLNVLTYFKRLQISIKHLKSATHVIATGKFSLWSVSFCKQFYKFKAIAVIHGTEVNLKSFLLRKSIDIALQGFDKIFAVSNYTKSLVTHLNKEVIVIPNGIDLTKWEAYNHSNTKIRGNPALITVGRVSLRKGQLQVIKHLPELIKRHPELHYHCVGIPTEANKFSEVANELGVLAHVTFHGSLEISKLFSILNQSDIFMMLSKETSSGDVEGFGIAILEANLLGIPTIGSKGCGIEDAIDDRISGILVESKDAEEVANAIDSILNNKQDFRIGAFNWVRQFDWTNIVKLYMSALK